MKHTERTKEIEISQVTDSECSVRFLIQLPFKYLTEKLPFELATLTWQIKQSMEVQKVYAK